VQARPRIEVHRVRGEVLQLGERLEAGVAAADEDVGEHLLAPGRVLRRVRGLERRDDVVAQPDRVGEALEADPVLGEAGDGKGAGNRPEGEQELVVAQLLSLAVV
jgi:hypothetical protein